MNKKEIIKNFISEVKKDHFVPEYCYNQRGAKNKVYYSGPLMDEDELVEAIDSLLFGKWFSSGEKVYQFEREFSKTVNQKYSVMVNSGSSANLVMISALKEYFKWQYEDEILISVVGFPTTLNPIIQTGLKPVFVDIEYDTLNFDLDELVKKISSNTKAIFVSPVLGNPPDMDKLVEIAKKYNLEIIMDGCDSYGSKWDGKHLDEYAVSTSCSFYPAHHITTGEGGMVSSNMEEIVKLARTFAWWGRDCFCVGPANLLKNGSCNCRFSQWIKELPYEIDHKYFFSQIGYNLKPLDLQGGIGLAQLKKADFIHETRKRNKDAIQNILSSIKGLKFPNKHEKADVSWFGVPVICETFAQKSKLVNYFENNGIQTRNYFAGNILLHPAYKHLEKWSNYPNATNVLGNVFFLGSSPTITQDNLEYIKEIVNKYEN